MNWQEALEKMRREHVAVRRKNWTGGKHIFFVPRKNIAASKFAAYGCRVYPYVTLEFVDHVLICTKDDKIGFYATTQCDMLADDWEVALPLYKDTRVETTQSEVIQDNALDKFVEKYANDDKMPYCATLDDSVDVEVARKNAFACQLIDELIPDAVRAGVKWAELHPASPFHFTKNCIPGEKEEVLVHFVNENWSIAHLEEDHGKFYWCIHFEMIDLEEGDKWMYIPE